MPWFKVWTYCSVSYKFSLVCLTILIPEKNSVSKSTSWPRIQFNQMLTLNIRQICGSVWQKHSVNAAECYDTFCCSAFVFDSILFYCRCAPVILKWDLHSLSFRMLMTRTISLRLGQYNFQNDPILAFWTFRLDLLQNICEFQLFFNNHTSFMIHHATFLPLCDHLFWHFTIFIRFDPAPWGHIRIILIETIFVA